MHASKTSFTHRAIALIVGVFGLVTVFSGGSVALRLGNAHELAGNVVPFVVWFNFIAGIAYMVAAFGIWNNRNWARFLAAAIAVATALVIVGFSVALAAGQAFEMRTVGALGLRFLVWTSVATWLMRKAEP